MGDLGAKLRAKLLRRRDSANHPHHPPSITTSNLTTRHPHQQTSPDNQPTTIKSSVSATSSASSPKTPGSEDIPSPSQTLIGAFKLSKAPSIKSLSRRVLHRHHSSDSQVIGLAPTSILSDSFHRSDCVKHDITAQHPRSIARSDSLASEQLRTLESSALSDRSEAGMTDITCPDVVVSEATPDLKSTPGKPRSLLSLKDLNGGTSAAISPRPQPSNPIDSRFSTAQDHEKRQPTSVRSEALAVKSPHNFNHGQDQQSHPPAHGYYNQHTLSRPPQMNGYPVRMSQRKIWVKRTGTAPTIVHIKEDDLVDEVKDSVLAKYKNSLGRSFDAPDVTIRILLRDRTTEHTLKPDETISQVLDQHYPNGQSIEEALIIDVPARHRSPRPSPRHHSYHHQNHQNHHHQERDDRPAESGNDYFPPMPPVLPSPAVTNISHESRHSHGTHDRAMSVLNTGHVPPLPSPSATRRSHVSRSTRPVYTRQATTSPSILQTSVTSRGSRPRLDSNASGDRPHILAQPAAPPLPTPPPVEPANPKSPTPRIASPRPARARKSKQKNADTAPSIPQVVSVIDTAVPPINVLIVEDNHINMKLLEQFIRRLKVRWQTAVNGREAVDKWRQGGFHLVLMDIQLPIMSGLEATKEIRRLERVNNIGVFSNTPSETGTADGSQDENDIKEGDRLGDPTRLFKSPVIIVALTASNLQSDRHEALAAGCNDFLTKPVNFVWFERKVKEWGCMQALIDFDGWRNWKDFATQNGLKDASAPGTGLTAASKNKTLGSRRAAAGGGAAAVARSEAAQAVQVETNGGNADGGMERVDSEGTVTG